MRTVVIGAGLAGLTCAARLRAAGHDVLLLDKGRGAGGRASTRRGEGVRFDHGATCVEPRAEAFASVVDGWVAAGVAAPWSGPVVDLRPGACAPLPRPPSFVGVPGMSALLRHAGRGLEIRYRARASGLRHEAQGWALELEDGGWLGGFDRAALALPAEQARALLETTDADDLAGELARVRMQPCWTLLVHFARARELPWSRALPSSGPLAAITREHTKPGRSADPAWVVQATHAWSAAHLEATPETARALLLEALEALAGPLAPVRAATVHRWRYAAAEPPLGVSHLLRADGSLGVCGDWCLGDRLEDAYLSGDALGRAWGKG
ncbi:MAG: NAD(P)-binding protein [Planctomycetes bacterium]|nr:NAD(P)-binding protein [Planctomycetota bacterium]